MPSTFDQIGSAYMRGPLMGMFGEARTFRPYGAAARSVNCIINFEGQQEPGASPIVTVDVQLDTTDGVTLAELDRGEARIDVEMEEGGMVLPRKIARRSNPHGGMVTLEIR